MAASLSVIVAAGCAPVGNSIGTKMDKAQIDQIQKGVTTRSEVEAKLGPPQGGVMIMANGDRWGHYVYVDSRPKAQNFIPYVGLFIAGTNDRTQNLHIIYTKDAIVKDFEFSDVTGESASGVYNSHTSWTTPDATK